ncbi:TlpA family protein disulfide reductase [Neisseriaceae bacterium JH1-16]|nr:TlpA family protein disulfide reductase [Neisseriaceae bacterium JH1-16]
MTRSFLTLRRSGLIAAATLALSLLTPLAHAAGDLAGSRFTDLATGRPIGIEATQGKVTVVNFWATWCAPCREEMPMIAKVGRQLAGRGVAVVGIALDNKVEVNNFRKQFQIDYPIWLGDSDTVNLMRNLGNPSGGLPFTLVLDRSGKPVARLVGKLSEQTLRQAVEPRL